MPSVVNPNEGNQRGIPEKASLRIYNPKEDTSWLKKEVIPRCQRDNSKEDQSWHQKKLIPRFQRDNFAPKEFEIKIWVLNFGRRVKYSNIRRGGFPFARLTSLLSRRSGKNTDVAMILKILCPNPWINLLLCLETNSLLR